MNWGRTFLAVCFSIFAVGRPQAGETIAIPSLTFEDEAFLAADLGGADPVTLTGELDIPQGRERPSLVVLLHGSDGPTSGAVWNWSRILNKGGIATLKLDSYGGRGLSNISADQQSFGQFLQIYDAYRAAELMAADPRINADKIVLMGFSRGGNAALFSAMNRFRETFGPKHGRIAAHLPFYPACNFELNRQDDVSNVPIRLFHGELDDWTPAKSCRAYIAKLLAHGSDAQMIEFSGAAHAFDNPRGPAYFSDLDWQTSRNCLRVERDGVLANAATGKRFSYDDECVERGPHTQYNGDAAAAAEQAVLDLLQSL